jgi:hypothetical protein
VIRLPDQVLGGRLRTSTLLLVIAFAVVLAVYVLVRPLPGTYVDNGGHVVDPAPPAVASTAPSARPTPGVTSTQQPVPGSLPGVSASPTPGGPATTAEPSQAVEPSATASRTAGPSASTTASTTPTSSAPAGPGVTGTPSAP